MSFFETEKPVNRGAWASVYIKWNDDRGRAFQDVSSCWEEDEWIELEYMNPEAGLTNVRISKEGIRWVEFFTTKLEETA